MSLAAAAWVLLIIGYQPAQGYTVQSAGFATQAACIAAETYLEGLTLSSGQQIFPPAQLACIKN